jgi:DNA-directed RNA polymerase II subunit RPB2
MVKSKLCNLINTNIIDYNECAYDHGGYFIVGGNEKVVISNDRICENIPFVFKEKNLGNLVCEVRSTSQDKYCPPKLFKLIISSSEN